MAHDAGGDNRYTRGLAELIGGLRYERIPTEVIDELCDIMPTLDRLDDAGRIAAPLAR